MADTVLFEFLHTEMVAELWAPDLNPGPGEQKTSLSVLEGIGFPTGQALGERLPRETLAFREELDVLKFLCKDLWVAVFQKQMDGLRTNHQDNNFLLLVPMASGLQYLEEAPKFLAFTCGLLCGTLHTLGVRSLVTASVTTLPACPGIAKGSLRSPHFQSPGGRGRAVQAAEASPGSFLLLLASHTVQVCSRW
ncbi:trafficking protein particle complex subunit 6A isoform 2-T2 [Thomomys bottae]